MNATQTIDMALAYADVGERVLALFGTDDDGTCACRAGRHCKQGPGKHPRWMRGVQEHGVSDATRDPAIIERWPERTNIGWALPEGVVVLDFDPRNGSDETWDRLLEDHGTAWQDTAATSTPGGGYHLAFDLRAYPAGSVGPSAGVDVRRRGNYIVVPPSMRGPLAYAPVSGAFLDRSTIAPVPEWLPQTRRATRQPSSPSGGKVTAGRKAGVLRYAVGQIEGAEPGTRNDALLRMTRFLRRAFNSGIVTEAEALEALARCPGRTDTALAWKGCAITDGLADGHEETIRVVDLARAYWAPRLLARRSGESELAVYDALGDRAREVGTTEVHLATRTASEHTLYNEEVMGDALLRLKALGAVDLAKPASVRKRLAARWTVLVPDSAEMSPQVGTPTTNYMATNSHYRGPNHVVWYRKPKAKRVYYALTDEPQTPAALMAETGVKAKRTMHDQLDFLATFKLAVKVGHGKWVRGPGDLDTAADDHGTYNARKDLEARHAADRAVEAIRRGEADGA